MLSRLKSLRLPGLSFALMMVLVLVLAACSQGGANTTPTGAAGTTTEEPEVANVARPSNAGGPGEAISLTGDKEAGEEVFKENCVPCHGEEGKGGVPNPGSTDGTIPPLNPIDPTLKSSDAKTYATNLDLFIEHGSTPEGKSPQVSMIAFGDNKTLTPQQIADVIAYVEDLNK